MERTNQGPGSAKTEQGRAARVAAGERAAPTAWPAELQQRLGNAAILRLLQARLTVSQPDDPYEQEAERVADAISRTPPPGTQAAAPRADPILGPAASLASTSASTSAATSAHRPQVAQPHRLDEDDEHARWPAVAPVSAPAPDAAVAPHHWLGRAAAAGPGRHEVPTDLEAAIGRLAGRGAPLAASVRADLEPRFGADLSAVRVHTDAAAQQLAGAVAAEAFTVGTEVVFGPGQFAPETTRGRHLLAHELTHVLQQTPTLARNPDPGSCQRGHQVGSAHAYPEDRGRWPSGSYGIWGPPFVDQDSPTYADQSIAAWITWRFGQMSPAVAERIRAEATRWRWQRRGEPQAGCQHLTQMSMADMQRLVALASRDPAARQAEAREGAAGMPALPPPGPIPDEELVVTVGGGSAAQPEEPAYDPRAEAERALDPTSIYEGGTTGATDPPFPARMDGPELEVPRGIGTFRMALDYAAVTADPLLQMAYHMNLVNYHWELFEITQVIRRGLGAGVTEEMQSLGQTMPVSPQAAAAAGGATAARAEHATEQLDEETRRAWAELRDPRRAAEGGSAVDVVTRAMANRLNLELLPASAIVAAGGQALYALSDLMSAYDQEREIAFPNRQGFFLVRCIAQPSPRGPQQSERRAASVRTKIVEVRPPERLAENALDMGAAEVAELNLRKAMTSDPAERARLDDQIARVRLRTGGDLVEYLQALVEDKDREQRAAQPWQRGRLDRELAALRLRLEQARAQRAGAGDIHHRPQAAFTSLVTGDTYPLLLELNELTVETGFRVRLMDATVPDRPPIERNGATREQAVRNAFNELAFHSNLGRGRLVVRMPASWEGEPRTLSIPTGDANTALVRRRLQDLATALLVLSLVVPGAGEVAAVIGSALAVDRLLQRALNGTLRLDAEAVGDTLAIVGAIAQGAQLVGRLRVVRAGRSFIAAAEGGEVAALEGAATALEAARRTGQILEATSTVTNVGGLIWGDLVALDRLAQIQQDELEGRLTHAEARRQRADLLGAAIRDHGILLAGALRPARGAPERTPEQRPGAETAPREGAASPPVREPGAPPVAEPRAESGTAELPPRTAAEPRAAETLPESELEQRARQAAAPATGGEPTPIREDGVRARVRTPDGLHEVFILNDGRVFRCSLTCAQLRTWYEGYLRGQGEGTRRQTATLLEAELAALEARAAAGENTPALHQALGALDVRLREFIAPDLAAELQQGLQAAGRLPPGERLLTTEQTRGLLRVFNIDEIQVLAGPDGFRGAEGLRRLAEQSLDFQRAFRAALDAFAGDATALRSLTDSLGQAADREGALALAYERAAAVKSARGATVGPELLQQAIRTAMGPLMDARGQLTRAGIAFIRGRFPSLQEGRRGTRGARETPLSALSDERIRQEFARQWRWLEALVIETFQGDWLLRGETATDFLLASPQQSLRQIFARLEAAIAAEGTGRQTDGGLLQRDVYAFVQELVRANDPLLRPAWDRLEQAAQDRRLPELRRQCQDFLNLAESEPFLLGAIGDKRPDAVEVMLSQHQVAVYDATFAYNHPIHNFKTAFYIAVMQRLIDNVQVEGGDYRSIFRQTPIGP